MVLNPSLFSRETLHLKVWQGPELDSGILFLRFRFQFLYSKLSILLSTHSLLPLSLFVHNFGIIPSMFSHLNIFYHDISKSSHKAQQMPIFWCTHFRVSPYGFPLWTWGKINILNIPRKRYFLEVPLLSLECSDLIFTSLSDTSKRFCEGLYTIYKTFLRYKKIFTNKTLR